MPATPPYRSAGGNGVATSRKKKKEPFSPTLTSIDSQAPAVDVMNPDGPSSLSNSTAGSNPKLMPNHAGGVSWDTETDHMLSYFLGGDPQHAMDHDSNEMPDFATSGGSGPSGTSERTSVAPQTSILLDDDDDDTGSDHHQPPPTPAMQFYSHTPSSTTTTSKPSSVMMMMMMNTTNSLTGSSTATTAPGVVASNSSSSSSLSSLAAALASGQNTAGTGNGGHLLPSTTISSSTTLQPSSSFPKLMFTKDSPISPAEAIGSGIENLMLPPPPRRPSGTASISTTTGYHSNNGNHGGIPMDHHAHPETTTVAAVGETSPVDEHSQHLKWLRDINAMARANGGFDPNNNNNSTANNSAGASSGETIHIAPATPTPATTASVQAQHAAAVTMFPGGIPAWALPHTSSEQQQSQQQHALFHHFQQQHGAARLAGSEKESEEKRALRLQRNRESARKSRRLKKERLSTLERKVNKLHGKISDARLSKIMSMVAGLRASRHQGLTTLCIDANGLLFIVRNTGPSSEICRSVSEFQYTGIRQMILPRYQSMLQWFALQPESYFTLGKAEFIKNQPGNNKTPIARLSSKQVGDEMSKKGNALGPSSANDMTEDDMPPKRTSYINDAARMWPLFCYELSFSVEQEEKFLAAQKRLCRRPDLPQSRKSAVAACKTSENLKSAVDSLCTLVSRREEATTAGVLTPQQAARYQAWVEANRGRCQDKVSALVPTTTAAPSMMMLQQLTEGKGVSMEYISERLSEVLHIRDAAAAATRP